MYQPFSLAHTTGGQETKIGWSKKTPLQKWVHI